MSELSRRGFLRSLAALAATSAIVPPSVALAPLPPVLDDHAFIQGLIDSAFAAGRRGVRIPAGTYHVGRATFRLPPGPFTIEGEGPALDHNGRDFHEREA